MADFIALVVSWEELFNDLARRSLHDEGKAFEVFQYLLRTLPRSLDYSCHLIGWVLEDGVVLCHWEGSDSLHVKQRQQILF